VSLFETVSQIGSAVGAIGGTGATYIWHRFEASIAAGKRALEVAKSASETADHASKGAKKALERIAEVEEQIQAFVRAIRAELDALKSFPSVRESPVPGLHGTEELRREIAALREELRSEILRERGQRHALQSELAQTAREQVKSWVEMTTSVAELKGAWEFLKANILSRKM
jgi:hypothetical protein